MRVLAYISSKLDEARFAPSEIAVHGTTSIFLRSILKQGMVVNPKQKRWDKDENTGPNTQSRVSLAGSYWTTNWGTASAAATNIIKKFGGDYLFVFAKITIGSAKADEDDIGSAMDMAFWSLMREHHPGITTDSFIYPWYQWFAKPEKRPAMIKTFGDALHKILKATPEHPVDYELMGQTLYTYMARLVSYDIRPQSWNWRQYGELINDYEMPRADEFNSQKWEVELLRLKDRLSRRYRATTRANDARSQTRRTMRIDQPVTFSGANRIVGVAERDYASYRKPIILHYGVFPEQYIEQYREATGPFPGVVDRQGRAIIPADTHDRFGDPIKTT